MIGENERGGAAASDRYVATPPTRKQAAQERIRAATIHIENAQHELERACQALSALNHMHPEQQRVSKLVDKVKAQFYRLSAHSYARVKATAKAELDHEPHAGEHAHSGCCPGGRR